MKKSKSYLRGACDYKKNIRLSKNPYVVDVNADIGKNQNALDWINGWSDLSDKDFLKIILKNIVVKTITVLAKFILKERLNIL